MKKINSFLLTFALLFGTLTANAEGTTIKDLYGTYIFNAEMEVTEAGQAYTDYFTNNCEVTIQADRYGIYLAQIIGIAGSTKSGLRVSDFAYNRMIIHNWNDSSTGNFDVPIWMTTSDGINPFSMSANMPDFAPTYDPYANVINLPNFAIVYIDNYDNEYGTILAKFTNATLTPKDKEQVEVQDLSGSWTYTHGDGEFDYNPNTAWSPDFSFTLEKTNKTSNLEYIAHFTMPNLNEFNLIGTFDGTSLTIPFAEQKVLDINDTQGLFLADNDYVTMGDIVFNLNAEGELVMFTGFMLVRCQILEDGWTETTRLQWYLNGTATKDDPTNVEQVAVATNTTSKKYLHDGNLIILKDGKRYTVSGQRMK